MQMLHVLWDQIYYTNSTSHVWYGGMTSRSEVWVRPAGCAGTSRPQAVDDYTKNAHGRKYIIGVFRAQETCLVAANIVLPRWWN